jgi:adenylate cyclase
MRAHDLNEFGTGQLRTFRPIPDEARVSAGPRPNASAAILFADIVGFTGLSERLTPHQTFSLLAGFHDRMAQVVGGRGASICDAIGDGVMAVWAGPSGEHNAAQALSSAFAMLEAMRRWSVVWGSPGAPLRIGVGLHAGPVMTGRTGTALQSKLSAFGDAVNVAHRLERLTRSRAAAVIASSTLLRAAGAASPVHRLVSRFQADEDVVLPGRAAPIRIRAALG